MQTPPEADTSEILFEEGIIGVPKARRFQLLEKPGSSIRFLKCLDIEGFALPVVDPRVVDPAYKPSVSPRVTDALGLDSSGAVLLLAVATLDESGAAANLRAPLLINVDRRLGIQLILDDPSLSLRAPVNEAT